MKLISKSLLLLSGVAFLLLFSTDCYSQLPQLDIPFKLLANGNPIDLYDSGHAAPFVVDFNGDGKKDIVIGEFNAPMSKELQAKYDSMSEEEKNTFKEPFGGKARVYINMGTDKNPVFGDYTYLQAGGTDASVQSACCIGFDPNFIDLDGDGTMDVTSGEYFGGYIHFYRGIKANSFVFEAPVDLMQPDTILKSEAGMVKFMRTANFIDFDKDGCNDMIWGNIMGEVYYSQNIGTKEQYKFANSVPLTTKGKAIILDGKSDPLPVDWDNDSVIDLLVGTEAGDIVFFKGKKNGSTDFEQGISIWTGNIYTPGEKPKHKQIKGSLDSLGEKRPYIGYRIRLGVADWNNDKELDLLVGNTFTTEKNRGGGMSGNIYIFLRK